MTALSDLRNKIRIRTLVMRSIERITSMEEFGVAYNQASDTQKAEVIALINGCDKDGLLQWLAQPEELSLRELRVLGQRYGVAYYSRLSKAMLLSEISIHRRNRYGEEAANSADRQGQDAP